jgi:hypothetical protein
MIVRVCVHVVQKFCARTDVTVGSYNMYLIYIHGLVLAMVFLMHSYYALSVFLTGGNMDLIHFLESLLLSCFATA